MTEAKRKRNLLIGGRRIRVADLIRSELLEPGQVLVFSRRRLGHRFEATVEKDGTLTIDGHRYTSPSSAARAVADISLDGWHAWQVGDDGPYLHNLREQLLDQQTREIADTEEGQSLKRRQEFLATVDESGRYMAVQELLNWWGAVSRSQAVTDEIDADLANHDLVTTPSYLKVGASDRIHLRKRRVGGESKPEDREADLLGLDEIGVTLGNISSAGAGVVSVNPTATLEEAITEMYLHDFSQLPVIAGPRSIKGAVTWKSIARARHRNVGATLKDAIVDAKEHQYDTALIDVLPDLYKGDFVLVRGPKNEIAGIVTAADVVDAYGALATPFLLIGELDQVLRRVLANTVDIDTVKPLCHRHEERQIDDFTRLTMGDYETILQNGAVWAALGWPFDHKIFLKSLSDMREVRNDVMHFNRDAVPAHTINRMRQMIALLREYAEA